MKRFLDWFSTKTNNRLRASQIKILYQNQAAVEFLLEETRAAQAMGMASGSSADTLRYIDDAIAVAIVDLAAVEALPEGRSSELLKINSVLKLMYAGHAEGKRRARQLTGEPIGDLPDFAKRFMPASGWDSISDVEWDRMVARALKGGP